MALSSGRFAGVLLFSAATSRVVVGGYVTGEQPGVDVPIDSGTDVSDDSSSSSDPGLDLIQANADEAARFAAYNAERATQLQAKADEDAQIGAIEADKQTQLQAEAHEAASIAADEAEKKTQVQAQADEEARIAAEDAEKQTKLKAETDEAARIAADDAERQTQLKKEADKAARIAADEATLSLAPPPPLDVHTASVLAANADKSAATAVADAKGWAGIATDVKAKAVDKLKDAKVAHQERIEARKNHAKALAEKEDAEMQKIHGDLAKLGVH